MATFKRIKQPFYQVKLGEIFLKKENEAVPDPYIKIKQCKHEDSTVNAARLRDGKVFLFCDPEPTYSMTEYTFG